MKKKKMILLGLLLLVIVILGITMCSKKSDNKKKYQNIVWSELQLSKYLPEPKSTYGEIGTDLKTALSVTLKNISEDEYKDYKEKCINLKYTIESDETPTTYSAFNEEGYKVRLVFSDKDFYIHLDAPEEMSKIEWPTSGLGSKLPVPNSTFGKISWNNDETFIAHIGNTSLEELSKYIEKCEEIGFNIDSIKDTKIYKAYNSEKYELSILYLGNNNIEISLHVPKNNNDDDDNNNIEDNKNNDNNNVDKDNNNNGNDNDIDKEDNNNSNDDNNVNKDDNTSSDDDITKDKYSSTKYKEQAMQLFEKAGKAQYPYGIKFHWITGKIDEKYQGNGNYYFRIEVTVNNEYGTKRKGIATGYIDLKTNYIDFSVGLN